MRFEVNGYIVMCKEPETDGEIFMDWNNYLTSDISEAVILFSEKDAENMIRECDEPDDFFYKPIEVKYLIKDLKFS